MAEKDDREKHLDLVAANTNPATREAARKVRREHITRKVNGREVGSWMGFTPEKKDFPMTIVMGCGGRKVYDGLGDFPLVDAPCSCEDENCFFVDYPR